MAYKYNPIRYYKKFKSEYLQFVLFIKCGENYYTYDTDAKIAMHFSGKWTESVEYRIKKTDFASFVRILHYNNLNVVLAGSKNAREYYTDKENKYAHYKKKCKQEYTLFIRGEVL